VGGKLENKNQGIHNKGIKNKGINNHAVSNWAKNACQYNS